MRAPDPAQFLSISVLDKSLNSVVFTSVLLAEAEVIGR